MRVASCIYDPNGICASCVAGYHVFGESCEKDIEGCSDYLSATACRVCRDGFYLTSSGTCKIKVFGCNYNNGVCNDCYPPFTYDGGACVIEGCDSTGLTSSGCQKCFSPYILTSTKTCSIPFCLKTSNRKCIQCSDNYYLRRDGTCVIKTPNCLTYDDLSGTCTQCLDSSFYLTVDSTCAASLPGCIYTNGQCSSCKAPFVTDLNNKCKIFGCAAFDFSGCTQCK